MYRKMQDLIIKRIPNPDPDTIAFLTTELSALEGRLDATDPTCPPVTMNQVGMLCGAVDLEREDSIELLSGMLGFDLMFSGQPENPKGWNLRPRKLGEPSRKDLRISIAQANVLIEYFKSDPNAQTIIDLFGYERASDQSRARRLAREALTAAKRAEYKAGVEQRRQEREAKRKQREEEKAARLAKRQTKQPSLMDGA